jgi:two-component system response regulator YesN
LIKVVIIDDEEWIRFLIKDIVPWEKLEMKIIGEAGDGLEGWALCKKVNPEIVLTDIRMPGIDGLGLLKKCLAKDPNLIGIILSGHSDFEYAQTAINYGVYRYILKPIDEDELIAILTNAKADIEKRRKQQTKLKKLTMAVQKIQSGNANDQFYPGNDGGGTVIHKALALLNENYHTNLTLESIADRVYLNASYFSDLFKKEVGQTFIEYLSHLRVEKAKELLNNFDLKISEIATLTGFDDSNYFAKVFKKYVGMTPSQYREALSARQDGDSEQRHEC